MLIALTCIAGIVLGLTFNVLVLVPATVVGALAYGILVQNQTLSSIATAVLVLAVSLQAGYMIGLTGREMLAQLVARFSAAQSKRV